MILANIYPQHLHLSARTSPLRLPRDLTQPGGRASAHIVPAFSLKNASARKARATCFLKLNTRGISRYARFHCLNFPRHAPTIYHCPKDSKEISRSGDRGSREAGDCYCSEPSDRIAVTIAPCRHYAANGTRVNYRYVTDAANAVSLAENSQRALSADRREARRTFRHESKTGDSFDKLTRMKCFERFIRKVSDSVTVARTAAMRSLFALFHERPVGDLTVCSSKRDPFLIEQPRFPRKCFTLNRLERMFIDSQKASSSAIPRPLDFSRRASAVSQGNEIAHGALVNNSPVRNAAPSHRFASDFSEAKGEETSSIRHGEIVIVRPKRCFPSFTLVFNSPFCSRCKRICLPTSNNAAPRSVQFDAAR